ncbi:glycosyltransferase family 4 protein [Haladaptatus halobius]|uniref:glycosyltransferase family 4 protein n=1 Tax=Haladaptatus halobius TaxID=2884875 RepID=UPI001D0BD74B|nr:glycosyltransferase family 4 protein [Haladaptatus halobius]
MARICLINSQFPPHQYGGAENYVLRTAKALQNRDHEILVLTTEPYDDLHSMTTTETRVEGVRVKRFFPANISHRSGGNPYGLVGKAIWHQVDINNPHASYISKQVFNEFSPDIVHTNNLMGISPQIGAVAPDNVHHVHTLHDYSLTCPKSNRLRDITAKGDREVCENPPLPCRIYANQKKNRMGKPDFVTGPSNHVISVHKKSGFFLDSPTQRIQLGVESVRNKVPPNRENTSLLYVGKQLKAKGLETLFNASRKLPDVTVHVCGSGPFSDKTATAAKEIDNLHYHGFVKTDQLAKLREKAAAAVIPSIWMENSPLTIYESFAQGLPVVGSNIGGIPELIEDGKRGVLFEPGNSTALVHAVRRLLDDLSNEKLRENCLSWAQKHTIEDHVDNLEGIAYKPVIK